ncbi:MAG TPA: tetratricopeptide repeat protein [Pirellulales bacterium]|nr:tetratricopeptide repeat protein [Pirellulales bacterium]
MRIALPGWLLACVTLCSTVALRAEPAPAPSAAPQEAAPPADNGQPAARQDAPLELEDAPQPFKPERPATEADRSRVEALSLFAAGRMKEQHEDYAGALQMYERALRYDPDSLTLLRQIVSVAFKLDRTSEAFRYALKVVELDASDARMLQQLAALLSARQEFDKALELARKALALQEDKQSAGYVVLLMEIGRLAYLTGQPQEAADAFAEVVDALDHPDDHGLDSRLQKSLLEGRGADGKPLTSADQTYQMFGEVFLAADRPEQALAAFDKANSLSPNPALHAYQAARVAAARKQPAQALESLEQSFEAKDAGQGKAPYELLAQLLKELNRSEELAGKLEKLRASDPKNGALRLFLAGQYRQAKQFDKAEPLYREAAAEGPSAEAYQGLAAIYRETANLEPLLNLLGEIVAKTDGLIVLGEEAKSLADSGELLTNLAATARQKHQADPDSLGYGARLALALLALEDKRFDLADEFFNLALKVRKENAKDLYQTWGLGLLLSERYEDAAKVFQRGIDERAVAADDPTFHYFLSAALTMSDRHDDALAAAKHAVMLNDKSIQLAARPPWILYHAKRYDESAQAYRDLLAHFDDQRHSDAVRKELKTARLILSNIAVMQNDIPQAEEWLEQVLDEFPDDISAKNDLGYLWADQGKNLQQAYEMVRDAVEAEPDNQAYRDSLGWALYRLGRHEEAVTELKKAADVEEPDGVILEHLGDALKAAGQIAEARAAWHQAVKRLEASGETDKAKRIQEKLASTAEASSQDK